jgi:general stress protein CsbA
MKDKKKKPYLLLVIFGAVSLAMYVALFTHQDWVTETFTKGGYYAAYPIVAAFLFSFIHGAFASNLLSVIGLEAKKK